MSVLASIFEKAIGVRVAGSSAFLALALGTAPDAANRIGLYADTTGAAEQLVMVVGAQAGPAFLRSGSSVIATALKVDDATFQIVEGDKSLAFQVGTQSSGFQLTIDVGAQAANRTLSVPVLTANATLAVLSEAQTFTGEKTFSAVLTTTENCVLAAKPAAAAWVSVGDNGTGNGALRLFGGSGQIGWQIGSNITTVSTLEFTPATTPGGTTFTTPMMTLDSDRLTLPKANGTTLTVSSTTDATSKDAASVVLEGGLAVEKSVYVGGVFAVTGAAGTYRNYGMFTNSSQRWGFVTNNAAESGANAGSNLTFDRYSDAGSYIESWMVVTRSTGDISIASTTDATSSTAASVALAGGLAVAKGQYVGTFLVAGGKISTTDTSSSTTASLNSIYTPGGFGVAGVCVVSGGMYLGSSSATIGTPNHLGAGDNIAMRMWNGSADKAGVTLYKGGSGLVGVVIGSEALATNATDGFLYVPTCAGTPTGAPTAHTGRAPLIIDSTNNKLYFYSGAAWRDAGP